VANDELFVSIGINARDSNPHSTTTVFSLQGVRGDTVVHECCMMSPLQCLHCTVQQWWCDARIGVGPEQRSVTELQPIGAFGHQLPVLGVRA
jgi:hypothetical protein